MQNRYGAALARAHGDSGFIDLINTNYHDAELRYPADELARLCADFYTQPARAAYSPDPAGAAATRAAIARWYAPRLAIDSDAVVVTASASESYGHIFAALCPRGSKVLLPRPGYPLFEDVARRHAIRVGYYPLSGPSWEPDVDAIEAAIDARTRALVLISPNNPTGRCIPTATAARITAACVEHDLLLVVDEVFSAYRYGPGESSHSGGQIAAATPEARVCTINGASKLFAAPELKVSWIVVTGPDPARLAAIEALQIQNDLFLSAAPVNQYVVEQLLDTGADHTARIVAEVSQRRSAMIDALSHLRSALPDTVTWCDPDGGIHLPLRLTVDGADDEQLAIELLERDRLNVHPGYLYGIDDQTVLIASFLPDPATIREGVSRLGERLRARARS
ncbi:MAG: pyridoxal phosphate-dependent aminotransferase [Spirochaetaceae bacterium]|nr:MAG: pyridoxal phosphate-dependent aminotransferase [Spirochaetaceae bacterium]